MGGMMGGIGDAFGSFDPDSGDPNGGLSGGQLFARKAVAGALSGAGQALQGQANGGTGGAQQVDFSKLGGGQRKATAQQPQLPYQQPDEQTSRPKKAYGTGGAPLPYQDDEEY